MPAVLVAVFTVMQNSLHPLSTSSTTARHPLDFTVQGKITEADAPTIRLDATPSGLSVPLPPSSQFMPDAISAAILPIYHGLEQTPNNAGLHTHILNTLVYWFKDFFITVMICTKICSTCVARPA